MSEFEETGHKVSLLKAERGRGVEAGRRMTSAPVAPVIDQLTAARRRLTNALRLGANTAKPALKLPCWNAGLQTMPPMSQPRRLDRGTSLSDAGSPALSGSVSKISSRQ